MIEEEERIEPVAQSVAIRRWSKCSDETAAACAGVTSEDGEEEEVDCENVVRRFATADVLLSRQEEETSSVEVVVCG